MRLAAALLLFTALGFSLMWPGAQLSFFRIDQENDVFVISWEAEQEIEVDGYTVLRRTPHTHGDFVEVDDVRAQGSGQTYTLQDQGIYEPPSGRQQGSAAEQVSYRLEVTYVNGVSEVLVTREASYQPTAVRRTWGSIKAMFQ